MWRIAESFEDEAIVAMCLQLYAEDPSPEPVTAEQVHRTLHKLRAEPWRGRALVLDLNGKVQGYALLMSFWSNELGGELCNIDEIYVAPHLRSQGLATALIQSLIKGRGPWPRSAVAFELEVTPNNHRARALYQKLGFKPGNSILRFRLGEPR